MKPEIIDTLKTVTVGAAGVAGVEAVDILTPENLGSFFSTLMQAIISIVTLFGLLKGAFKSKKDKPDD